MEAELLFPAVRMISIPGAGLRQTCIIHRSGQSWRACSWEGPPSHPSLSGGAFLFLQRCRNKMLLFTNPRFSTWKRERRTWSGMTSSLRVCAHQRQVRTPVLLQVGRWLGCSRSAHQRRSRSGLIRRTFTGSGIPGEHQLCFGSLISSSRLLPRCFC